MARKPRRELPANMIHVIILDAWTVHNKDGTWKGDRPGRYVRPYVGLTVAEAVQHLEVSLPMMGIMTPYWVNNVDVTKNQGQVLVHGDVLKVDDP